jgi:hypothetical protein
MNRKNEWPTAKQMRKPDPETVRRSLETYAKVVRDELPLQQRPEFRIQPEDLLRRISGKEAS